MASILERLRNIGNTKQADRIEERKKTMTPTQEALEKRKADIAKQREAEAKQRGSMSATVNVADSGTPKREEKEDVRTTTETKEEVIKDIEKTAPEVPKATTPTTQTPAPTEMDKVDERGVRRSVREEYKPIFDQLDRVEDLAAQGKTEEINLYKKNANDIIALLDEQLGQLTEIKNRKDITAGELAEVEKEREAINKEKLLAQNALDRASVASQFKDAEALRAEYNEQQRVRLETFAGIKGGFGSSAQIGSLENVMNEGQRALDSLRVQATQSDAQFANQALNIEKDYNLAMSTINANLNAQLMSNEDDLMLATQQISQNKLLSTQERDEKIQQAITRYNDKLVENELRTLQIMQQQNQDTQARITQAKSEAFQSYQMQRDEAWMKANFDLQVEQMGIEQAQQEFKNNLDLMSTMATIQAQEAGSDLALKSLQQQLTIHNETMEQAKLEFEMTNDINWYNSTMDAEMKAAQLEIDNYRTKNTLEIDEKNLAITEEKLLNETASLALEGFYDIKDPETGETIFYNPTTGEMKTPMGVKVEASTENGQMMYWVEQAFTSLNSDNNTAKDNNTKFAINAINNGDMDMAKERIIQVATENIDDELVKDAVLLVSGLDRLTKSINEYKEAGGQLSYLQGTWEDIMQNVRKTGNTKLLTIVSETKALTQWYRRKISGAAFSEQEAAEYASLFPDIKGSFNFNQTVVDSLAGTWTNLYQTALEQKIGTVQYEKIFGGDMIVNADGSKTSITNL
jgi:hypothetical protein